MGSYAILNNPVLPSGAVPSANAAVTWSLQEQYGPDDFWDPGTTTEGFVVPAGVTEVEVFYSLSVTLSVTSADCRFDLRVNGTVVMSQIRDDHQDHQFSFSSGVLQVAPGDVITTTWETFGTGTQTPNALGLSRFSICTTDRLGLYTGLAGATTITNTFAAPPFTAEHDPLACQKTTTRFVAPSGAKAVIVSVGLRSTAFGTTGLFDFELLKNGVRVAISSFKPDRWFHTPPCLGLFPVASGDLLELRAKTPSGTRTIDITRSRRLTLEWLN